MSQILRHSLRGAHAESRRILLCKALRSRIRMFALNCYDSVREGHRHNHAVDGTKVLRTTRSRRFAVMKHARQRRGGRLYPRCAKYSWAFAVMTNSSRQSQQTSTFGAKSLTIIPLSGCHRGMMGPPPKLQRGNSRRHRPATTQTTSLLSSAHRPTQLSLSVHVRRPNARYNLLHSPFTSMRDKCVRIAY
jgi:hypothetical protein